MPTCQELTEQATLVRDPFFYLQTDGTDGSAGWKPIVTAVSSNFEPVDYQPHFGLVSGRKPWQRTISKLSLSSPVEVWAEVRLLSAYYDNPSNLPGWQGAALRTCPGAQGWYFPAGRVRALNALASYGAANGFGLDVVGGVVPMLLQIFSDLAGSVAGAPDTEVVYAAADVIRQAKTPALDLATWIPLWVWAVGGPRGNASTRTRVMAMKAIQAILRRKGLLVGQIKAADSLAAVLRGLVTSGAPGVSAGERNLYVAEAQATVGASAAALIQAQTDAAAGVPPTGTHDTAGSWVKTWWPVGAVAAALLTAGTIAIALVKRRQAAV